MNQRVGLLFTLSFVLASSLVFAGPTTLVSRKSNSKQSTAPSGEPSISGNGLVIAFGSQAVNQVPARCNNGFNHILVRDQKAHTTTCVSVNSAGNQASQDSHAPAVSSNGQFVAFDSAATDLQGGRCDNGATQVYLRDRVAGTTTCVSVNSSGNQGNGNSVDAAISSNGQWIAFNSIATDLQASRCDNGFSQVYVRDVAGGKTTCVSVHNNGTQGNGDSFAASISGDGQLVVFQSMATNLSTKCTNGKVHIYIHDLTTDQTNCVSLDSNGNQSTGDNRMPQISANGLFVAFQSDSADLTNRCTNGFKHIYVRDQVQDTTTCISVDNNNTEANNDSFTPVISSDGQWVGFASAATNLTTTRCFNGNDHIFVRDRVNLKTKCASLDSKGKDENGNSLSPSISANGSLVAFESNSTNLVKKDTNGKVDIFTHALP